MMGGQDQKEENPDKQDNTNSTLKK